MKECPSCGLDVSDPECDCAPEYLHSAYGEIVANLVEALRYVAYEPWDGIYGQIALRKRCKEAIDKAKMSS